VVLDIFVREKKGGKKELDRQCTDIETGLKVGAVRKQSIKYGKYKGKKTFIYSQQTRYFAKFSCL
jgi:hypothetical protein